MDRNAKDYLTDIVLTVCNGLVGIASIACIAVCSIHFNNFWLLFFLVLPILFCTQDKRPKYGGGEQN